MKFPFDPWLFPCYAAARSSSRRVQFLAIVSGGMMTADDHEVPILRGERLHFISNAEQLMVMPASSSQRLWTLEEFYSARDAAPPGERWEFVDGEVLVTSSPHWTHQRISIRLAVLIYPYVREHGLGELFTAPLDVKLDPRLVLQPDLLVVPKGELRRKSDFIQHLLLAVEVISPSSARHDRVRKRPAYQRNHVPDYWIIDDRSQTVERWGPNDERPEILADQVHWQPAGAAEPFVLDLTAFFAEVLPEDD